LPVAFTKWMPRSTSRSCGAREALRSTNEIVTLLPIGTRCGVKCTSSIATAAAVP
jgi:hypothetical protein